MRFLLGYFDIRPRHSQYEINVTSAIAELSPCFQNISFIFHNIGKMVANFLQVTRQRGPLILKG